MQVGLTIGYSRAYSPLGAEGRERADHGQYRADTWIRHYKYGFR